MVVIDRKPVFTRERESWAELVFRANKKTEISTLPLSNFANTLFTFSSSFSLSPTSSHFLFFGNNLERRENTDSHNKAADKAKAVEYVEGFYFYFLYFI